MLQPPAHGLEVLATELTHNVWRASLGSTVGSALDPRSHTFDFVLDQGFPVFAVDVAPPAVEVSGIVKFVSFHCLLCVEGLEAAFDVAWHIVNGLEWHHHLVELECGDVLADGLSGKRGWSAMFVVDCLPWLWSLVV